MVESGFSKLTLQLLEQINHLHIVHWRFLPFTLQVCPCLPSIEETPLNKDSVKNYRPVPNLSFLSKGLETVVVNQLNSHINSSNTSNHVTTLGLLDVSAACDTIDRTIFLRRLDNWFGATGKTIDWFESYRTGRCQRIKLGDCLSFKADVTFGVPHGSVLLLPSIPLHLVAGSVNMLSLTISMLMTAICIFPLH